MQTNSVGWNEPFNDEPLTVESILAGISELKKWQATYGAKPLEPVEVTAEQWEMLKARLPVRNAPFIFASGVAIVVRTDPSPTTVKEPR